MTAFRHWCVVVTNANKSVLDLLTESEPISQCNQLANIHELKRDGKNAIYAVKVWKRNDVGKKATLGYVGQTSLTDEEMQSTGNFLIR